MGAHRTQISRASYHEMDSAYAPLPRTVGIVKAKGRDNYLSRRDDVRDVVNTYNSDYVLKPGQNDPPSVRLFDRDVVAGQYTQDSELEIRGRYWRRGFCS
jgi:hypothetical protein